jgi:hypothetical protein
MGMNPRLLRPTASGFTPARIADLGLWLDASVTSSLTFNGSTVSEWRDLSGNGRHFAQSTAGSQPTGNNRTQNGLRVLDFDGGDQLQGNAATLNLSRNRPGLSIIIVASNDNTAGNRTLFTTTRNGSSTQGRASLNISFSTVVRGIARRTDADSAALLDATVASTLTPRIFEFVMDYANGDGFLFLDGASALSNTSLTTNGNTSDTNSDACFISDLWLGFVAEIVVYTRAISAPERQSVERYLGRKWNITVA